MKNLNTQTELDQNLLGEVVADAVSAATKAGTNSKRWVNAIARATVELESNPFMTFNHDSNSLIVMSSSSGATYEANGSCQCRAFELGQPCWHRAAAKLVINYLDRTQDIVEQ